MFVELTKAHLTEKKHSVLNIHLGPDILSFLNAKNFLNICENMK